MSGNIVYTHLENGIHQFYWSDVDLKTVQEYVKLFMKIYGGLQPHSVAYVLHDYRDTGTPSFNIITNTMKKFEPREDVTLRIAHLYSDSIYPMIMKNASMVAQFNLNRQFFKADQEQQAIDWLLGANQNE